MSLASGQRNLATKNRKLLQESSQNKITQSLMEGSSQAMGALIGFAGESLGLDENKAAWESVEAGQEYLGMDKESMVKPSLRQKLFNKPSSMMGQNLKIDDTTEISLGNLQSLGTLAKSENRSLYESMAGDKGLSGAYTTKRKSNLELQGMDASGAYKDQTRREESPYMGDEKKKAYNSLHVNSIGGFSENAAENNAYSQARQNQQGRQGESGLSYSNVPGFEEFGMALPDNNATAKDIQSQINKGYANAKSNKKGEAFDAKSVGQNYYKLMEEGTTPEAGQSYYDALIARREELRTEEKSLGN